MIYRKNLYSWEQVLRVGVAIAAALAIWLSMPYTPIAYGVIAMAALFALTGIFGFCPACAMVGRRLKLPDASRP
jgi:hypothetical protein